MAQEQWKGKWKPVRELGGGGQGTTYEVTSISDSSRSGVLKLLKRDGDEQARARMAHEAINLETLAKLGVKVPALLDHNTQHHGDTSIQLYIVMEFVQGETLDRVVKARGGRLTLEESVALARALCATIGAMHARDVLHRDLKPANLMVRDFETADVVVLDLGLSFDRENKQETRTRTGETMKNELMALPEMTVLGGNRRDPRSDITNIVSIFFYCLTGHLPGHLRDGRNRPPHQWEGMAVRHLLAGDPRRDQVEYLFDMGFETDIEVRFQTIKELEERLELVLSARATKKDPLQLDAEMGALLRKRNRQFQLQEFIPAARVIEGHLQKSLQTLTKAKTYEIGMGGMTIEQPLPPAIDKVYDIPFAITVRIRLFPHRRHIKFMVGAKAERCVVLSTVLGQDQNGQMFPPSPWEEVAWFNPTEPPSEERVSAWLNDRVTEAMEFLGKAVAVDSIP
jgi:serine/threonine protein kinase